jgi:hypothetical protein
MTAIISLKCSACGKIHRMCGETQPETPDQFALEAARAGWGFRMDQDRLALICSFTCGQDVMPTKGTPRKHAQRPNSASAALG